ncbi:MAG TPA: response regulator transcription factor [Acidimicrobiales bacterium]|nr:response regulator transcription factor [Acidimicrobiales bacterium]
MSFVRSSGRILIIDDDHDLREMATVVLEADGFEVVQASSAMEAFEAIAGELPDLVILDMVMPAITGLEVLQNIRQRSATVPILILSGLGSEENRVRGLQLGADDYVTKPYSPRELVARVHALLRRSGATPGSGSTIVFDGLAIDLLAREVTVRGEPVPMTAMEFDLLAFFASHPGRVYTRHQLLREVWQSSSQWQQANTVTEHVRRVRAKIELDGTSDAGSVRWIETVRGVGYRFARRAVTATAS